LSAALGVVLAGCVGDARPARYYGGGYYGGPPGYYGSPYYGGRYGYGYGGPYGGYDRFYGGPRGYYGGGRDYAPRPSPRIEGRGTQEFLRQHWLDQARQAR
jgi:hypothetical protein